MPPILPGGMPAVAGRRSMVIRRLEEEEEEVEEEVEDVEEEEVEEEEEGDENAHGMLSSICFQFV